MSPASSSHRIATATLLALFLAGAANPSWRGQGTVHGSVRDDHDRPVPALEVTLWWEEGGSHEGLTATTDAEGRFTARGLATGPWRLEVQLDGYYPGEGSVEVGPGQTNAQVDFRLRPLTEDTPRFTEGHPATIRAWIDKGDALMTEGQWTRSRTEYEKAVGALPPTEHPRLLQAIARTLFMDGFVDDSTATMERALAIAPNDEELRSIYSLLMTKLDRAAAATAYLDALPETGTIESTAPRPTIQIPVEVQERLQAKSEPPLAGRTGVYRVAFSVRSPHSALDVYLERTGESREEVLGIEAKALGYDLSVESYQVVAPESYERDEGWGLLVYVSPTPFGGSLRKENHELLARHRLIWVGADHAGNDRPKWNRWGLALDAAANMADLYDLDPDRIYVSGYSGGGRVTSGLALLFGDVFSGGLCLFGVDYFRPVPVPHRPGAHWPAAFHRPPEERLANARRKGRYVIVTGEKDFNRQESRAIYELMVVDGFERVELIEIPGADHYAGIGGTWFDRALDALDAQ